ncbi:MAG: hypothetical protein CSA96_01735 [Bacteroidetes bacterium]|nr:MAG: hypothetical protein CSA96_01735 [Bacteroidota bacterium]
MSSTKQTKSPDRPKEMRASKRPGVEKSPDKPKGLNVVSGASGFLGSHLLHALLSEGRPVRALKRSSADLTGVKQVFDYYGDSALFEQIEWRDCNLLDPFDLREALAGGKRAFHCAGMVSFERAQRKPMLHFNLNSTINMLDAAFNNGFEHFLHVSSSSAIGSSPDDIPANESMIWSREKDSSAYGHSKFMSEMEVWRAIEEGLPAAIVNPTVILGPGFWTKGGSSSIFHRVAGGLRYATPGTTGFVGVKDVVSAMIWLSAQGLTGERFIVNAANASYKEVFEQIASALGMDRPFRSVSARQLSILAGLDAFLSLFGLPRHITREQARSAFTTSRFSGEKLSKALGRPLQDLESVIRETALYYRKDYPLKEKAPLP